MTGIRRILAVSGLLALAACGGGGGKGGDGGDGGNGGNGGNGGGPPPPPPTSDSATFQVTLTHLELVDRLTDENVAASGLPVSGAMASLDP